MPYFSSLFQDYHEKYIFCTLLLIIKILYLLYVLIDYGYLILGIIMNMFASTCSKFGAHSYCMFSSYFAL